MTAIPCPTCCAWTQYEVALRICPECAGPGYIEGTPEPSAAEEVAKADIRADTSKRADLGAELWNLASILSGGRK